MDLLMKNIHMCRQARSAGAQITLDEDLNVPDANPDVEQIIQSRERVVLEHVRGENGKVFLDGTMDVSILYMDDTEQRNLHRLDTKLSFDEVINMEGVEAGETVSVRYETEDLNVTLINSRKLAIRALLSFGASVDEIYDLSAAVETQTGIVCCQKRKKLELMQLEVQKKDIYRLKEDIPLPSNKPELGELLWDNVQLRGCRIQLRDGELEIYGKLFLFVLYRGMDEKNSVQWMEQVIPFEGKLECSGCRQEMVPDISVCLSMMEVTAREDTDGEMRQLHLEGVLDLEIRIYGSEETEILEDVYSPDKKLRLLTSEDSYESLVIRNESKCRAGGKIRIQSAKPRILQICHSNGSVKVDQYQVVEDGIRIEGALPVSILYISSDDKMPFAVLEGTIPFTHVAEVPGIDDKCRISLTAVLDQLSATMADSEEIEVRGVIGLTVFTARPMTQRCIHEIQEENYSMEEMDAVPGITGYIVQEGETLWDIARKYYLMPQQVMEMNGLEKEEVKKGDCLILMKRMMISD